MREVFQQDLSDVQGRLVEIAKLVETSITASTTAFGTADVALAEKAFEYDREIDRRSLELDELAIQILALQSPVARDLRIVVSALRISASLERMGALSAHIAQIARFRFPGAAGPESLREVFTEMSQLDVQIAGKLVELLRTQDVAIAAEIERADDRVDELHQSTFEPLANESDSVAVVDGTLASRYHERFADHAVSIAKKIEYLAHGDWQSSKE